MNESIKIRANKLGKNVDIFLKSKHNEKICDRAKNILIEYDSLINKITINNWKDTEIKRWFKLENDSGWYAEDAYIDAIFYYGSKSEKLSASYITVIWHLIQEDWHHTFRNQDYEETYNNKFDKVLNLINGEKIFGKSFIKNNSFLFEIIG